MPHGLFCFPKVKIFDGRTPKPTIETSKFRIAISNCRTKFTIFRHCVCIVVMFPVWLCYGPFGSFCSCRTSDSMDLILHALKIQVVVHSEAKPQRSWNRLNLQQGNIETMSQYSARSRKIIYRIAPGNADKTGKVAWPPMKMY
jgi:hypothetical protein